MDGKHVSRSGVIFVSWRGRQHLQVQDLDLGRLTTGTLTKNFTHYVSKQSFNVG